MPGAIEYRTELGGVDWAQLKATLVADDFDNGRTPEELRESFERSHAAVVAHDGERIVGTARALSDGVCNAYIVDVWTLSAYRRRGVAREMIRLLEARLEGQHVYLFSEDAAGFYERLGYAEQPVGLSKVVGRWLRRES